jgi:hypothetical protein
MHPYTTLDQTTQLAADRARQLRVEAKSWRQARHATRSTRVTRDSAA